MIKGIGIDIVDIDRIAKILENKPRFARRILTENEYHRFEELSGRRQAEFLAGRFACKEAFSKAWGTGIGKVGLQDIEVLNNEFGAPVMTFSPHVGKVFVSISHTDTLATAQVLLEE
ncbi:MAG: holo-ACP synthase [Lactobacillales bacterium]|jgi:holo-[acyl-carrier protein] synthase|nr:holo-ACP synthase [Lactobacillales bacterium]